MLTENEEEISEMYAQFEPHGPGEFINWSGCYMSVNRGRWARAWWARNWTLGPVGRLPR